MDLEMRPITDDELVDYAKADAIGFGDTYDEAMLEDWRGQTEFDRTLAVFDRGRIVATAGIFSFELTLPGLTTARAAGVTSVVVHPTHRRRGVLRRMMARQLDDIAERGEPLAVLTASETSIYRRFGYGVATTHQDVEIESDRVGLLRPLDPAGRVELIDAAEASKVLPGIFDQVSRATPGDFRRSQGWWDAFLRDHEKHRGGGTPRLYAVYEGAGGAEGYASYRIHGSWEFGLPTKTVGVREIVATTTDALAGLVRFLADIDLTVKVRIDNRPADDPLRWILDEPRRLKVLRETDFLWVRPLDIPVALAARRYGVADHLVLDVADGFRPANAGRYLLEAGPDGASCARTDRDADIALDVADLGSLLLGGVRASTLARAGAIAELTPGAVGRATRLFLGEVPPFCQTMF